MSLITTALLALTSLTGFATSNKVDTTIYNLSNACTLVNEDFSLEVSMESGSISIDNNDETPISTMGVTNTSISDTLSNFTASNLMYYNDVYNLKGYNAYLEIVFANKYVLYDKVNNCIIETGLKEDNPYKDYKDCFKVYDNGGFGFKYLTYINDEFINIETYSNVSFTNVSSSFSDTDLEAGDYYSFDMYESGTKAIDDEFYFRRLYGGYGANINGTCGIVSSQVVLGYMNFYNNENIVEEQYEYNVTDYTTVTRDFNCSPKTGFGLDEIGNEFRDHLIELFTTYNGKTPYGGMNYYTQYNLLYNYFKDKDIKVSFNTSEGNWGDQITNRAITIIKNAINNSRPCIANGTNHSVVAFAYSDDYVYVESGNSNYAMKTPWATFKKNTYVPSAIDIIYEDEHVCSNDYYSLTAQVYLCPCHG